VLNPIWLTKSETAGRLRGRIERVLDFAKARGWRAGENPAAWRGHLRNLLPKQKKLQKGHQPAMAYVDVPSFLSALGGTDTMPARALEFTILTASRSGEVLGAKWQEIDFDQKLWKVPKERMKAGAAHTVPLSERAAALLLGLDQSKPGDFVFPGARPKRPLSNMAMIMMLRRIGLTEITVHGFRSSFRDWAGDVTAFPRELAEAALAHKVGDEVERAYRRSDALEKRRKLMQAWADYLTPTDSANVIPIRKK
jgi:integrase